MFLVAMVSVSFLSWSGLYGLLSLFNRRRGPEWNCRLVTALHGVLSFSIASYSAFIEGPFPISLDVLGRESLRLHIVAMVVCLGYFLFDFSWCMAMQTEGPLMLCHHLLCITGLILSLSLGVCGAELSGTIVGSEITNPLLQLRWFLKQTNSYNSRLGAITDCAFVFLFITVRIGVGAWFFVVGMMSDRIMLIFKIGGAALYLISLIFLAQILSFARHKLFGGEGKSRKVPHTSNGVRLQNGTHEHIKSS